MLLCEEYLKRHGFDQPYVRYVDSGTLFLEGERGGWIALMIRWSDQPYHPGRYRILFCNPVHNGYQQGELFDIVDSWHGGWDEYEDFLLKWSGKVGIKAKPVISKRAVILAAWEMFLISHDGMLASVIHPDRVFDTVDDDIGVETRYANLQHLVSYLASHHPSIYNAWEQMTAHVKNYSYWLGDVVRKEASGQKALASPSKQSNV